MVGKKGKEELSSVDQVFERHKKVTLNSQFKRSKSRLFMAAIITGMILIFSVYLSSNQSKIAGVQVTGNHYLSTQEIMQITGLNENSRSLFVFESLIQNTAKKHPLIQAISIKEDADGVILIHVTEKDLVGYHYMSTPQILTKEGELIEMSDDLMFLITRIPLIVGFNSDNTETEENELSLLQRLAKAMKDVDSSKIQMISEIHQYSYSYDENGILCMMQDGNRVYGSFYSIGVLNDYNKIASALPQKKNCVYIDEMTKNPYTSLCPEEQEALEQQQKEEEEQAKNEEEKPS